MGPRGGVCWGRVVSDCAEWYARSDRSVVEAKVWMLILSIVRLIDSGSLLFVIGLRGSHMS